MICKYCPTIGLLFITVYVGFFSGGKSTAQPQAGESLGTVNAADLGKSIKVIGRLGKPMTEPFAIKGHWRMVRGTKASPYVFRVTSVADQQLETPLDFNKDVVSLDSVPVSDDEAVLGETWTCVAIELGQFRNVKARHWGLFYGKQMLPGSGGVYGDGPFVSELLLAKKSLERGKGERQRSEE